MVPLRFSFDSSDLSFEMPLIVGEATDRLESDLTMAQLLLLTRLSLYCVFMLFELGAFWLFWLFKLDVLSPLRLSGLEAFSRGVLKPEQSDSSSPEAAGVWKPRTVVTAAGACFILVGIVRPYPARLCAVARSRSMAIASLENLSRRAAASALGIHTNADSVRSWLQVLCLVWVHLVVMLEDGGCRRGVLVLHLWEVRLQ